MLHRELAQAYYVAKGYEEALATLEPIVKQGKADAETYKIMGQSYMAMKDSKRAQKILRDGLTALPEAGTLYHQMGLMYEENGEQVYALETWLDGIQKDPGYHLNYYEAARTYMNTNKYVWAVLYGEMFVNIEQQTRRANDTRAMMLEAYRKMFSTLATGDIPKYGSGKKQGPANFEQAVYDTYMKLSPIMSDGISTENLTMLRIRFIMDWTANYADKYPFSLFARNDDMIRSGYFDIYNQWLFGKAENAQQYEAWSKFHAEALPGLQTWLDRNRYIPVEKDFYNDKIVEGIFEKKKASCCIKE